MHITTVGWLAIVLAGVVCLIGLLWPRRSPIRDLGSVSDSWLAEHATNGQRS